MDDTSVILRVMLGVDLLLVALVAGLYLIRRRMVWWAYCLWWLLALLVPLVGPFIVLLSRPGEPRETRG